MSDAQVHGLLDGYQYATLLRMANFHGLHTPEPESRPSKQALIDFLQDRLFVPDHVAGALEDLTRIERIVLDRLVLLGGEADTETLRKALQDEGVVESAIQPDPHAPYEADPLNRQDRTYEDVISQLTLQGLVFSSTPPPSWAQTNIGFAPGLSLIHI